MYRLLTLFIFCNSIILHAQDSIVKKEEVAVISATRVVSSKQQVAVPIFVIDGQKIKQIGALKLSDVLAEQAGIFLTNGSGSRAVGGGVFGNGVQLQGMSPEHVLILVDGEPLIGRNGGTLDISRLVVGNAKQIEIVKGPFSSLFGSEAMGGVINIKTETPKQNTYNASLRLGSFKTVDIQHKAVIANEKTSLSIFTNNYTTNGYDLNNSDIEKTQDPFQNHSVQFKVKHNTKKSTIHFNNRYFYANQQSNYAINAPFINITGNAKTNDLGSFLSYETNHNSQWKSFSNVQYNFYSYQQQLDSVGNNKLFYGDRFAQHFVRLEQYHKYDVSNKLIMIAGAGYTKQTIITERYAGKAVQNAYHAFMQSEWKPTNKTAVSAGIRYDYNTDFKASINPKLAVKRTVNPTTQLWLSVGTGFKAPDFRQLYLDFINNASDSYVIYGTNAFSINKLQQQLNTGFVAQIFPTAYSITSLKPEQSLGINTGITKRWITTNLHINLFYNRLKNLIQYIEVARRPNGASVFSYVNINDAFTTGSELQVSKQIAKHLSLEGSYQFLKSGDFSILKAIKNKSLYGRDKVGGSARLLTMQDYKNLQNRSSHLAQLKMVFTKNNFSTAVRAIYRGKWGVTDLDGNGIANMNAEYAKANLIVNATVQQQLNHNWFVQIGVNNILNYRDALYMTNVANRNVFLTINYSIKNKKKVK